jgi:ketosteroid isomerase-like protein
MKFKLAAVALCAAGIAMPAAAGDADDVNAVVKNAEKAFNSCDVAAMQGITHAGFFGFNDDGTLETGNSMADMKANCDAGTKVNYNFTLLKTDMRGDMAVVAGTAKGTVTPKDGEAMNLHGKFTVVLVKDGGAWKSLHVHTSPVMTQGGGE